MKYCEQCKTGAERQFGTFCFNCGTKLVDVPVENCECGFKHHSHNAFCIKCGKALQLKGGTVAKDDIMKVINEVVDKVDKEVNNS
jgi:hypothetical protein